MNKIIVSMGLLFILLILPVQGNNEIITPTESSPIEFAQNQDYIPGMIVIKFTDNNALYTSSINALNNLYGVQLIEKVFNNVENTKLDSIYLLKIPENTDIPSIIAEYNKSPYVVYAEPNYIGSLCAIPNDEYFDLQWPLNNSGQNGGTPGCDIDALKAWDIEKGDSDIVIASVDSGIDYNHIDLADNIWINEDETPNNAIDDDGNGYVDDTIGWDFCDNDNDPMDELTNPQYGHGTWCAGLHSAVTDNGIGIAGVCWYCKTMVLRCYKQPPADTLKFAQGAVYAADNGANVINIEMAFSYNSQVLEDAVDYAHNKGCFLCAAAGNENSIAPHYPAAYENVTGVAATNQKDERCDEGDWGVGRGSNYGDWIDVAAPGNSIITLEMDDSYVYFPQGGTSVAAPFVAGLAGLILSNNPDLTPDQVYEMICYEGNVDPYISEEYIGTGRINAYKALISIYGDLDCEGNLNWVDVKPEELVTGNFTVNNLGTYESLLSWEITEEPSWGEWTFDPESGTDLSPEDGPVNVQVTCVAPEKKGKEFNGRIKIENINADDEEYIDVILKTPKNKSFYLNKYLINGIFERFPNSFHLMRYILG